MLQQLDRIKTAVADRTDLAQRLRGIRCPNASKADIGGGGAPVNKTARKEKSGSGQNVTNLNKSQAASDRR
jgi:hypothetical protein